MIDFAQFNEVAARYNTRVPLPDDVTTAYADGLRYRLYQPTVKGEDLVIVYHGGGVNIDAGYDILARQLVAEASLAVCLVDLRGHGGSPGARGHVSSPSLIWQDVTRLIDELKAHLPYSRLHLLGHSSGAGMLLNYVTHQPNPDKVSSLILVAPELGPFATGIRRVTPSVPFAKVCQWPFIVNALSRGWLLGHYRAVQLNLPARADFVHRYSVNMANALTPRHPAKQLAALPLPTLVLAAEHDELFDPQALSAFAHQHGNDNLNFSVMPHSTHLDCIFQVQAAVGQHILSLHHTLTRDKHHTNHQ